MIDDEMCPPQLYKQGSNHKQIILVGIIFELCIFLFEIISASEIILAFLAIPYLILTPGIYFIESGFGFVPQTESRIFKIAGTILVSILFNGIISYSLASLQLFTLWPFWSVRAYILCLFVVSKIVHPSDNDIKTVTPLINIRNLVSFIKCNFQNLILVCAVVVFDIIMVSVIGTDMILAFNDIFHYLSNPIVISLHTVPLFVSLYFRKKNTTISMLILFIHAAILRAAPSFLIGHVWSSDQFIHKYFSTFIANGSTPLQILQNESLPAYPLFTWQLLDSDFLIVSGIDVLFFIGPVLVFFLLFAGGYILTEKLFDKSYISKYTVLLVISYIYPLVEYQAYARPFEFISSILPFVLIIYHTQMNSKAKRSWFIILGVLVIGTHIMGFIIVQALVFYQIYRYIIRKYSNNQDFITLVFGVFTFLVPASLYMFGQMITTGSKSLVSNIFELFVLRFFTELKSDSNRYLNVLQFEKYNPFEYLNLIYLQFMFVAVSTILFLILLVISCKKTIYRNLLIFLCPFIAWTFWGQWMFPSLPIERIGIPLGVIMFSYSYIGTLTHIAQKFSIGVQLNFKFVSIDTSTMKVLGIVIIILNSSLCFIAVTPFDESNFALAESVSNNIDDENWVLTSSAMSKVLRFKGFTQIVTYEYALNFLYPFILEIPINETIENFRTWNQQNRNNSTLDYIVISNSYPFNFFTERSLNSTSFVEFLIDHYQIQVTYNHSMNYIIKIR